MSSIYKEKTLKNSNIYFDTRKKDDLSIPYHSVAKFQIAKNHLAIKLYNKLANNTKKQQKKILQKRNKNILLNGAFYKIEEFLNS